MPRYLRNTLVLAKLEPTYGVDPTPAPATDALLVSDVTINPLQAQNVDRDLVRGYFGGSSQLVGTASVEVSFSVELAGSGTPTTAPAWGKLLRACGMAETVQAASVDYTPISVFGASTSATLYYFLDGQRHVLLGARGTFTIGMGIGERPLLKFRFVGLDGGLTAVSNPSPTLTMWGTPLVVTDANTGDITIGSLTYTASTGVVSGGTSYVSRGLQLDMGNNVVYQPLLGQEQVVITQRQPSGQISLDLDAAAAVSFISAVKANTLTGMAITHGTAAGNIVVVYAPSVQRIDPGVDDVNGQALHRYSVRLVPASGNDELRIVSR